MRSCLLRSASPAPLAASAALISVLAGCSDLGPLACGAGEENREGQCVDSATRYEPPERIDHQNVVAYGEPLTQLDLPEPPKSGFRIVAPPRLMQPGEEDLSCLSWPYPDIQSKVIYASRLYTTTGLHHSNVVAKPVDPELGPNPYPACHPGASDPFSDILTDIPDVLFASSTQVVGQETIAFPAGSGFVVDTSREISTSIHYINASTEPKLIEVVYDFFTMPPELLEREVAPFVMQVNDFSVAPHATESIGATCTPFGGEIVSFMPHTHQYAEGFAVDLVGPAGSAERIFTDGAFDLESDILVYESALQLAPQDSLRFECRFRNTTDRELVYGLGDNEMCILFGYIHPREKQFLAFSADEGEPCYAFQIGVWE